MTELLNDPFVVNEFKAFVPESLTRKSKYVTRLEVVKARNQADPDEWGVIAKFGTKSTAGSTASSLRGRYKNFEFTVTDEQDENGIDVFKVWARNRLGQKR
jgi:hypothetical protein